MQHNNQFRPSWVLFNFGALLSSYSANANRLRSVFSTPIIPWGQTGQKRSGSDSDTSAVLAETSSAPRRRCKPKQLPTDQFFTWNRDQIKSILRCLRRMRHTDAQTTVGDGATVSEAFEFWRRRARYGYVTRLQTNPTNKRFFPPKERFFPSAWKKYLQKRKTKHLI